jgi:hypothetical protein
MSDEGITVLPRFLGEEGTRYFTLQFSCTEKPKAHIVFIPPFGEEMNRCRSLVSAQARNFARAGYACTLVDFYGTGDSQGGLIALDYASKLSEPPQDIILWQPVNAATIYVTQVLRQRVASLMVRDLPAETTKEIRQRLADGEDVEVAGYTVGGTLIRDIEGIDMAAMKSLCRGNIYWLEHVMESGKEIGVASRKAVDQLTQQGNRVEVYTFCDPTIWLIHERDFAPQLLAVTSGLLP